MGGIKMNENLDLTKILEGCPAGTEFYSSVFGNVKFVKITLFNTILMMTTTTYQSFAKDGRLYYGVGECTLFPSREQRDWSKFERFWDEPKKERFNPKAFRPFDRVLVRGYSSDEWSASLYSHPATNLDDGWFVCDNTYWHYLIPYNNDTEHLIGTKEDCPEYYKWWEE